MKAVELRLQHFRCHKEAVVRFDRGSNIILGPNGSGKSSLLEAFFFISRLRSFRTSQPREIVGHGEKRFAIHLETDDGSFRVLWSLGGKTLEINGEPVAQNSDFWGRFPCVLFSSHDIALVRGTSLEKNRFFNGILSMLDRRSLKSLLRYRAILRQRNAMLARHGAWDSSLFKTLTHQMETVGRPLQDEKKRLVSAFSKWATKIHRSLSASQEELSVSYREAAWEADSGRERHAGRSLVGFHLDDVELLIGGKSARKMASEGQQRTAAIAMRAAEAMMLKHRAGVTPVILVDDVFGELDGHRRAALLGLVREPFQMVVATTEETPELAGLADVHRIRVGGAGIH